MTRRWMPFFTARLASPAVRAVLLTLYYLSVLLALAALYGGGSFSTPGFIYQGF